MTIIWLAWLVLVLRLAWKVLQWRTGYFFVASDRIVLVSGVLRRKVAAIWLAQVTAIEIRQRLAGPILGYGELVFHSPCPAAVSVAFDYAPYPGELFQEVRELAFPEPPGSRRFRGWRGRAIRFPDDGPSRRGPGRPAARARR